MEQELVEQFIQACLTFINMFGGAKEEERYFCIWGVAEPCRHFFGF
jgi:hypothetical protein